MTIYTSITSQLSSGIYLKLSTRIAVYKLHDDNIYAFCIYLKILNINSNQICFLLAFPCSNNKRRSNKQMNFCPRERNTAAKR